MGQYIIRRLLQAIPILIGITLLTFLIMQLAPGNPLQTMIDPTISIEEINKAEQKLGFDKPKVVQYFNWLKEILKGNLGYSVKTGQPVSKLIGERLPATLLLTSAAFILSFCIGVPLGVYSATHKYTAGDYSMTMLAFLGISIPNFFFGLGLIYVFALKLGWLPTSGMTTIGADLTGWSGAIVIAKHLIMPATVLALPNLATVMRFTRSSMIEVLLHDFIRTAKAKGLRRRSVVYKHALRNALIPTITIIGLNFAFLMSGAVLTETTFQLVGMGQTIITAINTGDYWVLQASIFVVTLLFVIINLFTDLI